MEDAQLNQRRETTGQPARYWRQRDIEEIAEREASKFRDQWVGVVETIAQRIVKEHSVSTGGLAMLFIIFAINMFSNALQVRDLEKRIVTLETRLPAETPPK